MSSGNPRRRSRFGQPACMRGFVPGQCIRPCVISATSPAFLLAAHRRFLIEPFDLGQGLVTGATPRLPITNGRPRAQLGASADARARPKFWHGSCETSDGSTNPQSGLDDESCQDKGPRSSQSVTRALRSSLALLLLSRRRANVFAGHITSPASSFSEAGAVVQRARHASIHLVGNTQREFISANGG